MNELKTTLLKRTSTMKLVDAVDILRDMKTILYPMTQDTTHAMIEKKYAPQTGLAMFFTSASEKAALNEMMISFIAEHHKATGSQYHY